MGDCTHSKGEMALCDPGRNIQHQMECGHGWSDVFKEFQRFDYLQAGTDGYRVTPLGSGASHFAARDPCHFIENTPPWQTLEEKPPGSAGAAPLPGDFDTSASL
jgi:hypothetical protein